MNRVDRLLAMILFLQGRRLVTAEQLAEQFGLSVRTVYRDLAALSEAGVPIAAQAGVGYSLMKGYHLPPVNFTEQEAAALITGGLLVQQFTDPTLSQPMQSALAKVRSVLPSAYLERIGILERAMATLATPQATPASNLEVVQGALGRRRVLRFDYRGAQGRETARREVEPHGLLYYLQRWHLIAWCRLRRDYRDFRCDRMRSVEVLDESFASRADFSAEAFVQGMPEPALQARIRFEPAAADRAKREWYLGLRDEQVEAGWHTLTLSTVEWTPLATWLLSFGQGATVLAPDALRQVMVALAEETAAHHRRLLT